MKILQIFLLSCLVATRLLNADETSSSEQWPQFDATYQWSVVGAGPAGIMVVALLLDAGVNPKDILWLDPEFAVGRLGKYYASVPANIKTKKFIKFLQASPTFMNVQTPAVLSLFNDYDPQKEYPLKNIVDPLIDITKYLKTVVASKQTNLSGLNFYDDVWHVEYGTETVTAGHVVLATGSRPRRLCYECENEIALDEALDKARLNTKVHQNDTVAVIGASHSAILILKHLTELGVPRILNFYIHPLIFDKDEVGLMGITAWWAQNVLQENPPASIIRLYNDEEHRNAWLPIATKIIYAAGYERNPLPPINDVSIKNYDDTNGTIGRRLFGIGIAFPETFIDEETCCKINKVGLPGFMQYAKRILPSWLASRSAISSLLDEFDDLFCIQLL